MGRLRQNRALQTRERHRIIALEHSLEQRGQLGHTAADLSQSVLGGKYRILRPVGSGGIGTVYAAEHMGVGFQVAVKVLRGAAAVDASEVARLRREARIQMSLEHPNIIRTFDLDQLPDGTLYVVMELLRGMSLQDQLRRQSPMAHNLLTPIFFQACQGLAAAHRLGIVHRDLKPGNVFLCEGGTVKVLDFGMSKLAQEDALTQDGYTLGTPEYMSPEQCVGGPIDARSDIYAFGILMYESLTGDIPFRSKNRRALLDHHQRTPPRPMRKVRPDLELPPGLDELVLACLEKNPDDRPQTAELLARTLARFPGSW
jgi:serine/threonine-protein kinase